ncbi:FAD-dependent oxidoreductase [Sphingomonas alba]|uniref:FAD-dependent oxidoreductase n=1 Tax=Sphingomonas alba TaxID=2908208 RepID=A0ABT0RK95_9SPHN|nr:FAD-dependent oxidoreductase [Sphingomonas alba]MCL6682965.1 FAD-dependent oxidoreductase [Sphingomonas alba]
MGTMKPVIAPQSKARVAVVGAGVFGAWTAEYLRRAGHQVTLLDASGPAHPKASSGGESRMTRAAYGKDAIYSRMARDSLAEWKSLGERLSLTIFQPLGVLFFTTTPDDFFAQSLSASRDLGLPIVEMDPKQLQARFPMIDFRGVELGLYEPHFGALMARRAVQALVAEFVAQGGEYQQLEVRVPSSQGALASIRLSDGSQLEADAFVIAAGPWLGKMFPELLGGRIVPTRQEIFYFAPPAGETCFASPHLPGWAEFSDGDFHYGFPALENGGVKFAHHCDGAIVDPDTQRREHTKAALDEIIAYRDRRFPLLRDAPLIAAEVCQYENSSNGDFLIDFHPNMPNVLIVGGGSGHGFKHGPEVGRYAAELLSGQAQVEPRFSLASKSAAQHREVH